MTKSNNDNLHNCPHCKKSLVGKPIPEKSRAMFGSVTHFSLQIGMEYPDEYDGVMEWMCPHCAFKWPSEVAKLKGIKNG